MRKRMESIKNTANNSNLNSIELTYLKKRKGLILNGEIKRDEDFDLLIQKLQKDHNNKFGMLGNNNLGSVFKMDSLEKGITTDYESVFCLLNKRINSVKKQAFSQEKTCFCFMCVIARIRYSVGRGLAPAVETDENNNAFG